MSTAMLPTLAERSDESIIKPKAVWVVFSATQYKIGIFIRRMLRTRFNHVSLSFDPSLDQMYTFARRYVNAPLAGGFVKESFRRFCYQGRSANIKVCRVELTQEQYDHIQTTLRTMVTQPERYLYNFYSAAAQPFRRRIYIHDSLTCVEFVGDLLGSAGVAQITPGGYQSLRRLEAQLSDCVVFCGAASDYLPATRRWGEDRFRCRRRRSRVIRDTAGTFARLTARGISDLFS